MSFYLESFQIVDSNEHYITLMNKWKFLDLNYIINKIRLNLMHLKSTEISVYNILHLPFVSNNINEITMPINPDLLFQHIIL